MFTYYSIQNRCVYYLTLNEQKVMWTDGQRMSTELTLNA